MPGHPSFGPTRKSCTRCRLHKRKCDRAHPSCSLCSRCVEPAAYPTPPVPAVDEALRDPPVHEALTPFDIKTNIITRLSDTDPRKIMTIYSKTIHPWFSIFSQSTFYSQHAATWDAASVDFALLCFAIVLLDCSPQQLQGAYTLHSTHRSMYLMSKTWITVLEGAGWNSIDFVKARLLITLFEVSHGFDIAAYFSIANAIRAADALVVFQQQGISQSLAEQDIEEYRIMWWGIAILDRALLLAFYNGSKATCSGASISSISQATAVLDTLIDDIVERVAGLNRGSLEPEESSIPLFVIFLVYKAAAITTGRLQNGIKPEANLQRLRILRNSLAALAQRWLAGGENLC
ncbi:hypothetical protein OIDMADRAFT_131616 [Oidiodendron maius Zn]|uniref:Zn(2)-C6 fungal-type domain-containing protein n=1 Tax=Oidiodendron maius (strain Zn) TaxID=913774 RepID=A0A0C3H0X4_OIDMZ|nr:hypothetical protein OIDMADRAFT_131616 [Oidiodendron maius Zn]